MTEYVYGDGDTGSPYSGKLVNDGSSKDRGAEAGGSEKRRFPRVSCRLPVEVSAEGEVAVRLQGTITDLSLSGCFVEMISPLPPDTPVGLMLSQGTRTVHLKGVIRNTQPGLGMGVAFIEMDEDHRRQLEAFAGLGTSASEPQADPTGVKPMGPPTSAEALEAMVSLLFRKGIVNRAEFIAELEHIRASKQQR